MLMVKTSGCTICFYLPLETFVNFGLLAYLLIYLLTYLLTELGCSGL